MAARVMIDYDEIRATAYGIARTVHRKYHTYFDVSDVSQELLMWCISHEQKLHEWLDHPVDSEEFLIGSKKLSKTLGRHADRICRRLKAQKMGYEITDEQYYSSATLEDLLPFVWLEVVETRDTTKPRVSGSGNPAEGGNYVVQLFDVRRTLKKIDPQDQLMLRMKYEEQLSFNQIAEMLDISPSTAHRKVKGALKRIHQLLGGSNPFGKNND
jgi:RNA polymerase sigma factor (sigma-70 family)